MSIPTEQPFASYAATLQDALEAIYGVETPTARMQRAWFYEALGQVTCGQMTNRTDRVLETARRVVQRRRAAA